MRIEFVRWGVVFVLGNFEASLVLGDLFIRVPRVGQLAWNQVGFFADRGEY